MADSPSTRNRPQQRSRSGIRLIGRGAVWVAVSVLVALTFIEFQAWFAARSTADSWRDTRRRKLLANTDLRHSELAGFIRGHPDKTRAEAEVKTHIATSVERYIWKGILGRYTVSVYLGLGMDRSVESVDGPTVTFAFES